MTCQETGAGLVLVDKRRGTRWVLDTASQITSLQSNLDARIPLQPHACTAKGSVLKITYLAGDAELQMHYILHTSFVEITLPVPASAAVRLLTLPGSFTPEDESLRLLLPIMQGSVCGMGGDRSLRLCGVKLGIWVSRCPSLVIWDPVAVCS